MLERRLLAIIYRLEHPESVPSGSWWAVYRQDIETLVEFIEKLQEELENERR